jgi:hypothetical protein
MIPEDEIQGDGSPIVIDLGSGRIKEKPKSAVPEPKLEQGMQYIYFLGLPEVTYNKIKQMAYNHSRSFEQEINYIFEKYFETNK